MDDEQIEARKRLARDTFGRELTTEQIVALGPRIEAAARNARILDEWEAKLDGVEPAAVHATPLMPGGGDDA